MKKLFLMSVTLVCMLALSVGAYAGVTAATTVTAVVDTVLSIEFAVGAGITFPGGTGMSCVVDPAKNLNVVTGHDPDGNGQMDIAVVCKSNGGNVWQLSADSSGDLADNLLYSMSPALVDGKGVTTEGRQQIPVVGLQWPHIPNGVAYISQEDIINTPYGTYLAMNIGIDGGGLAPTSTGTYLSGTVTFTVTTTP